MRHLFPAIFALTGLLATACVTGSGPRPVLKNTRVSAVGPGGLHTVRTRIQVDFQEIDSMKPDAKVEHLLQAVTFYAETPNASRSDRQWTAPLNETVETQQMASDYPNRVAIELVMFPKALEPGTLRLRAKNVYERPDDEASYVDIAVPLEERPQVAIESISIEAGDEGSKRIEVVLDRDGPAALQAWHHMDGKAYRLERKGSRIFVREFSPPEAGNPDHKVYLDAGGAWLSPPMAPRKPGEEPE